MENTETQDLTPQSLDFVREAELVRVMTLREQVRRAKEALETLSESLEKREKSIIARIQGGAACEGRFVGVVNLETNPGRSNPKWKEEYLGLAGADTKDKRTEVEEAMKAKYPAVPSVKTTLLVVPRGD